MLKSERECEELVLRIKILPALLSPSTLTQTTTDAVSLGSHTLIRSACLLLCGSVFIKIAHRLFLQPTSRRRASLDYRLGVINKRLVSTRSTPAREEVSFENNIFPCCVSVEEMRYYTRNALPTALTSGPGLKHMIPAMISTDSRSIPL